MFHRRVDMANQCGYASTQGDLGENCDVPTAAQATCAPRMGPKGEVPTSEDTCEQFFSCV